MLTCLNVGHKDDPGEVPQDHDWEEQESAATNVERSLRPSRSLSGLAVARTGCLTHQNG
jgi:hypothetical protein